MVVVGSIVYGWEHACSGHQNALDSVAARSVACFQSESLPYLVKCWPSLLTDLESLAWWFQVLVLGYLSRARCQVGTMPV